MHAPPHTNTRHRDHTMICPPAATWRRPCALTLSRASACALISCIIIMSILSSPPSLRKSSSSAHISLTSSPLFSSPATCPSLSRRSLLLPHTCPALASPFVSYSPASPPTTPSPASVGETGRPFVSSALLAPEARGARLFESRDSVGLVAESLVSKIICTSSPRSLLCAGAAESFKPPPLAPSAISSRFLPEARLTRAENAAAKQKPDVTEGHLPRRA